MSVRQVQTPWLTDVFTTTDATPHDSATAAYAPPSGSAGVAEMSVVARNTATGASASAVVTQTYKNVSGTVSLVGALTSIVPAIGDAGLLAIVSAFAATGGTTITPRLTGIIATNIEWFISVKHMVS
jgi:hypothetical protein